MEETKAIESNNSAKFAFFYVLSLVALGFTATSVGVVAFQVINKKIVDALAQYTDQFSPEAVKFAIAAIIISAPIYYFCAWRINKSLETGELKPVSGVRRWLTYAILLIASVTMIGWLIGTIFSFLNGELTTRFILKSLTAILISAGVFSYYFYDIKREDLAGKKDKVVRYAFFGSLAVVIIALVAAFIFSPSPTETRNQKHDQDTLSKFNQIDSAINSYYSEKNKLPENLSVLVNDKRFISERELKDSFSGANFEYKQGKNKEYELCANFLTSNLGDESQNFAYDRTRWPHDAGYQCLKQQIFTPEEIKGPVVPVVPKTAPVPTESAPVVKPAR